MRKRKKVIMERRRRRILSGVLAVLLIVALAVGLMPNDQVYAAEKKSDRDTTGSYAQNLGDISSTRYAGRVWTDKTVYTEDATFTGDSGNVIVKNDSDFLVAYSALATTQNVTGKSSVPVDVVFVIDNSNSMDESVGGGSNQSRLEATVEAVNTSIATIMESHPDSRVAVVLYGSSAHTLMSLGHYSASTSWQHNGDYIWYESDTYYSGYYGRYVTDTTFGSVTNNRELEMTYGERGTNIHSGVDIGMDILKGATNIGEGASKHVPALVLLSDGAATYAGSGNWWDPSGSQGIGSEPSVTFSLETAMHAQYQKQLVNNHYGVDADADTSCKIYTIGMGIEQLSGGERNIARLALNPGTYITENNNEANAMETAWNNYLRGQNPTMRYPADTDFWGDPEYSNYTFRHPSSGDISTIAYNDGYYSAENAEDVTNVFEDITSEIVSASAQAPTQIEGDPLESGYLTYTDPIGEYMQVDEVKTLIYGGQRFDNPTKEEINANTTKYTFEGEITSDVYGDLNASKIEITVTKGDDGNETLTVKIPAAAIPLRVNTVDIDENGAITNTNNKAYPARVLYTVGAREGVDLKTLEGVSDDYISANMTEDGQYVNFYSNKYSGNKQDEKTVGDATVTLTPAETNPFFYVQENTPLYTAENTNSPATSVQNDDTPYYFQITYYEGNEEKTEWVSRPGSSFWHNGSTDATITTLDSGQVVIKQGAPRLGYLTDFAQTKGENTTNTAEQVFHPVYDGDGQFTVYLGNNGVLKADAPKSLTVEKEVAAGEGLTAPDADFTFEVTVATKADTTGDAILTDANSQETNRKLTFDADGKTTFTLKDGQSMEILNIGEGASYTVKEINLPAGFTSDQTVNTKTGTVSATDADNVVTFTNTYNVTEVTTENLGINLGGTKSITGRDFQADDEFVFTIAPAQATPNAPLPTEDVDQDGRATTATVNPTSGNEVAFKFGDVTFDKPGEYRYVIREANGTLPGVDYDNALYRVNIIVKDNGDGTMSLASVDGGLTGKEDLEYPTNPFIQIWDGAQQGTVVDAVAFENNYSATDAKATIQGMKVLNSTNSDRILADDDFTFTVEALGYNTDDGDQFNPVPAGDPEQPMPANTEVKNVANGNVIFGEMTFTQDMIGNTYGYKITEKLPQGVDENNSTLNGITYDTSEKIVKVTVTRSDEGGEEHVTATVTPNDGTAEAAKNFTFTNTYEPSSVTIGEDTDDAITVQKTFTGRTWNDSDEFEYMLIAKGGAPEPTDGTTLKIGKPASGNSNTATFGDIEFVKEGVYEYEITETNGGLGGVTYDQHTAKVTVTVTEDKATGTLSAKVEYDNSAAENNSDKAVQDAAAFTNTYKAVFDTDTTVNLNGTKELTGKTLAANDFYFYVDPQNGAPMGDFAPTGDSAAMNPNQANGSIQLLKNVTYTEAGDYVYIIKEQIPNPKAKGMTYDESEYRVTVTVTDDQQGNLIASKPKIEKKEVGAADYTEADAVVFKNSYEPLSGTYAPREITKVLSGDRKTLLQEGEFSFEMSVVSAEPEDGITLPQETTVSNDTNGKVKFGDITFSKVGKYVVQVKEVEPADEVDKVDGVTYSTNVIKTTFDVKDEDGQLKAYVTGTEGSLTFTNTYKTTGTVEGATDLEVTKNFTGRENDQWLDTDEFTFVLEAVGDGTQQAVTDGKVVLPDNAGELKISANTTDHKAAFGDITFNAPGEYSFKITETKGSVPGVTYDGHEATFTVTATDKGDGTLGISTDLNKDDLTFTNTYDGEDLVLTGDTALKVKKELTVPEGSQQAVSLNAGDYSFIVTSEALDGSDPNGIVLPEKTTVSNDENGDVVFGDIKFTKAGTYKLTVKEVVPADDQKKPGVTYDTHAYSVTYKVVEDYTNGKLVVAENGMTTEGASTFENVYKAEGSVEGSTKLAITKKIAGRDWNDSDSFTFTLKADEDYGEAVKMGTSEVIITKNTPDHKVAFGDITFTQTGTYKFTIKEADPKIDKMTYDNHEVKVEVTVEDRDGNGTLAVVPTITGEMTFTNTHNPDDATASIEGTKIFTGRDIKDSDSFTFDIDVAENSAEDTPSPAESSVTVSGKDFTDGKAAVDFGTFSFDKEGTYIYTITEKQEKIGGVTYDNGTVTATVDVTYDNATGTFDTDVTYSKKGGVDPGNAFEFTNVYKALPTDPVTGVFSATKTVTPSEGNSYDMEGGEFEFTLTPSASNPEADPVKAATVKNDAAGAVSFISSATYTEPGTYVYDIKENPNGVGGITYDDSIYTVTVDVTDDGSGKLAAKTSITKDGTAADAIVFDNSYDPAETGLSIGGTKELTGKNLEADMFSFTLTGIDGAPMPADGQATVTAKNTAGGAFNFGEIKYDKVGEYKYEVSEVNEKATGVTYDANTYNVTVKVTDEDGVLKAVPSVENSKIVFKNSYAPIPLVLEGDAAIGGSKDLTGRDLKNGEFVFQLKDGDKVIAEAKNTADGTFKFDKVKIDKVGTYNYTISEKINGIGGIEYDKKIYNVRIDASDVDGYIKADVTYSVNGELADKVVFTNEYSADPTSVQFGAVKRLEGRAMKAGEFSFRLEDGEGNLISEAVNDETGKIVFDKIDYDQVGTFHYVISEIPGDVQGMTYDEKAYNVTVDVTDTLKGYLEATITYEDSDGAPVFVNTYTKPEKPADDGDDVGIFGVKTGDPAETAILLTIMGVALAVIVAMSMILIRRRRR
ncbi:FctA domain-containing protein [Massilistercora timonensis]|uniref:Spy0128 family protein n=1 Tax=Massilistercora timonensis TaxID=2086584 RepID=UPI00320A2280